MGCIAQAFGESMGGGNSWGDMEGEDRWDEI